MLCPSNETTSYHSLPTFPLRQNKGLFADSQLPPPVDRAFPPLSRIPESAPPGVPAATQGCASVQLRAACRRLNYCPDGSRDTSRSRRLSPEFPYFPWLQS